MRDIRIAAVTCRSVVGDLEGNLGRTIHWTRKAQKAGAELICFPELNLTGYCLDREMAALAQSIPGPQADILCRLSRDTGLILLAGMLERNPGGPPFVSHCVFQPDGSLSLYRKLHLSPNELPYFSRGEHVPVFRSGDCCFGIQLCYDGHFPDLATAMTQAGAEMIFLPHASPRGDAQTKHQSWMRHLPARAYDNSVFVMACNQLGENGRGLSFPGNAVILDPAGNLIKKSTSGKEAMLVADLTGDALAHVRSHRMRHFFPNRRPELYP